MFEMPIRIMQFDIDPQEVRDIMPWAFGLFGLSMTLPYLEPYLIRTMHEALDHVTDDNVRTEVKQFIGQEAQHFRQHRLLNDIVRSAGPELAGLKKIEEDMEADYQRFTSTKSLKFNLAYAEGFEAATCAGARNALEFNLLGDADESDIIKMFRWHLTEEIEHRTATFNIYHHLYGGYIYRLIFGFYGQWHFFKYVARFSKFIRANQPARVKQPGAAPMMVMSKKVQWALFRKQLATYLPWYNPAKVNIPDRLALMTDKFTSEAVEVRLPSQ